MRKIITYIGLIVTTVSLAQVGVNTTTPVQELHVAGATENVRIEGLSTTNNVDNLGVGSSTRVYADADGDLVLGSSAETIELLIDFENYLVDGNNTSGATNNQILQTGGGNGYTATGIQNDIPGSIFTLTKNAIVEVNYSISWSVEINSTGRIEDNRARIVQTGLYFKKFNPGTGLYENILTDVDGNFINSGPWCIASNAGGCTEVGGLLAINGQFYNNGHKKHGEHENFQNTASDYVKLGPGTYYAMFAGQIAVGSTIGSGAAKMYLGSGSSDELQIIAHYYY
jgi:hypothetical protein